MTSAEVEEVKDFDSSWQKVQFDYDEARAALAAQRLEELPEEEQ